VKTQTVRKTQDNTTRGAATAAVVAALTASGAMSVPDTAHAQEQAGSTPTVVIVRVPTPWYAPRFLVTSRMRGSLVEYSNLAGLAFKAYSFERGSGDYGGIYLWKNTEMPQNWFNKEWFDRVRRERGADAYVRMFPAPISIDNVPGGVPLDKDSKAVATLVEVDTPAGVTREALEKGLLDSVPTYQKVPGLLRKYFIMTDKGTFGGVYVWRDEASANAWFTPAFTERVVKTYGKAPRIEWFDIPILAPSVNPGNALPASRLATNK
jgi:hypothetical protein